MGGPTHYERLGVAPSASVEELRAAYRAVARRHHPDSAGSAAGGSAEGGAEMATVNEAWRVLSDPGRRAIYDRSLSGAGEGQGDPPTARSGSLDEVERVVSRPAGGGGRFPIWPFVILFVLGAIFIVTAGALSQSPKPAAPDNLLMEGSCATVVPTGEAVEVLCTAPHDGVVETVVGFDQVCPGSTEAHRDRQGRGWACLRDG